MESYLTDDSERIAGEVEDTIRSIIKDKDSQVPKLKTFRLSIEERRIKEPIPKYLDLLKKFGIHTGKAFELCVGPASPTTLSRSPKAVYHTDFYNFQSRPIHATPFARFMPT